MPHGVGVEVLMHPAVMEDRKGPEPWTLPKATPIAFLVEHPLFQILRLSEGVWLTLAQHPGKSGHPHPPHPDSRKLRLLLKLWEGF